MKNPLSDRMKNSYEKRFHYELVRRTYTILRIDGHCFSKFTKKFKKPFDLGLVDDFVEVTKYLCKHIQGAKFGYCQSDEISILITDFDTIETHAWFDNDVQKMCSIAASMATKVFNKAIILRAIKDENDAFNIKKAIEIMQLAEFDARLFQIPDRIEVENYFISRQKDCSRNSISSVAQNLYRNQNLSHQKLLSGKNSDTLKEMIIDKGENWDNFPVSCKYGQVIVKEGYYKGDAFRTRWTAIDPTVFTKNRLFLNELIPTMEQSSVTNDYVPVM